MGTKDITDKALIEALSENRPLTDEQRGVLVSVVMQQAQRDRNAERYLWLRPRLQVRMAQALSGAEPRPSLEVRIGQSFFDTATRGGKGYVDPQRFQTECEELDAQVDAGIARQLGLPPG